MWDHASPYPISSKQTLLQDTNQKTSEPVCHIYFDKFISFCRRQVITVLIIPIYFTLYPSHFSSSVYATHRTRLFVKWKKLDLTHNLTVIYFSRTYIRQHDNVDTQTAGSSSNRTSPPIHIDADGRYYEDHYKIVIENETRSDWESLIPIMKREFVNYPKGVKWE